LFVHHFTAGSISCGRSLSFLAMPTGLSPASSNSRMATWVSRSGSGASSDSLRPESVPRRNRVISTDCRTVSYCDKDHVCGVGQA